MDFLKTLIGPCSPTAWMIDVGANEGGYIWSMRGHRPEATILAFEPLQEFYRATVSRFRQDDQIYVFPYGVSDQAQTVKGLHVHEAWTLALPGTNPHGKNATHGALARTVEFIALDGFLDGGVELPRIEFLKIDTDGYEFHVLRGAKQRILRDRPTILIEVGYLISDLGESIEEFLLYIHDTLNYTLIEQDGTVWSSMEIARARYPYATTFDVAMIPTELVGTLPILD